MIGDETLYWRLKGRFDLEEDDTLVCYLYNPDKLFCRIGWWQQKWMLKEYNFLTQFESRRIVWFEGHTSGPDTNEGILFSPDTQKISYKEAGELLIAHSALALGGILKTGYLEKMDNYILSSILFGMGEATYYPGTKRIYPEQFLRLNILQTGDENLIHALFYEK